jgi:hypothetical protein
MTFPRLIERPLRRRLLIALCCLATGAALGPGAARAQGPLSVQLNKLEDREGACRAYFVFENKTGAEFETLTLDLVIFDAAGAIAKRLAIEAAPLPAAKTRVKLFDIQGTICADVARLLLNGVLACKSASLAAKDCAGLVEPTSRTSVAFNK